MKKIKIIGKALLVTALVGSSAQMFASEHLTQVRTLARQGEKYGAGVVNWVKTHKKETVGAIVLTGAIIWLLSRYRNRLSVENPEAAKEATKVEDKIAEETKSEKRKVWDVTRTFKEVTHPDFK